MHAWSAPLDGVADHAYAPWMARSDSRLSYSRGAPDHALLPLLLTRGPRPRISRPPLTSFPRRREPNVLRPTTYPPHPVVSRTHPRHSRVGGNPTSCVRRRIHGDTPAPQGHRLHSQNGSWMARPDSRLRGNDGVRPGDDGVRAGNDVKSRRPHPSRRVPHPSRHSYTHPVVSRAPPIVSRPPIRHSRVGGNLNAPSTENATTPRRPRTDAPRCRPSRQ